MVFDEQRMARKNLAWLRENIPFEGRVRTSTSADETSREAAVSRRPDCHCGKSDADADDVEPAPPPSPRLYLTTISSADLAMPTRVFPIPYPPPVRAAREGSGGAQESSDLANQ